MFLKGYLCRLLVVAKHTISGQIVSLNLSGRARLRGHTMNWSTVSPCVLLEEKYRNDAAESQMPTVHPCFTLEQRQQVDETDLKEKPDDADPAGFW